MWRRSPLPTLRPGDIVILDNLSVHKSARAEAAIRARAAWLLFLPQYSPDLNPSRWPSRSSKPICDASQQEASTPSTKPSATPVACSIQPNAETSSKPPDYVSD
jgi:hypothetical protein